MAIYGTKRKNVKGNPLISSFLIKLEEVYIAEPLIIKRKSPTIFNNRRALIQRLGFSHLTTVHFIVTRCPRHSA